MLKYVAEIGQNAPIFFYQDDTTLMHSRFVDRFSPPTDPSNIVMIPSPGRLDGNMESAEPLIQ